MENSRFLGNLSENIVYNGLLYTYNLHENAFINQFGHRIDPSAAPAFITEAKAFEQQNLAILDISSSSSDNSSSRPTPESGAEKPQGLIANPDNTKDPTTGIIITFTINDPDKADSFILFRATDPKGPFTQVKTEPNKFTTAFIDDGLTPGTTYYYQVAAVLDGKQGPTSDVVSTTTDTVKPPSIGITAPSGLTATSIAQNRVDLSWTDNSTNELGFYLYQSLNGSSFTLIEGLVAGATTASVKGLSQDSNYWYRVQAFATGSTSAFSNTVALRTLPTIPTAPSNLSLLIGGTSQIQVSWQDNSNNEQFFNLFRSTDGVSYPFGITLPAGSTTYLNTGLSAGTTYFYRVNAANTGGTSGFAGPESATTIGITIAAPTALSAYSEVPATKNFLRYTEGFTTGVSTSNGGWASAGSSTTVSIDNSVITPDGKTGAALLTANSSGFIGGINSIISESGVTANDYWTASVWLRGKTSTCGGINIVVRDPNQITIPSTLKVLSGPGTVVNSPGGETHWKGVTGLSTTEWTRIAWNNISPWGPTGFVDVLLRLTVNFYEGLGQPSVTGGDSIYVWGAQFERNPYPTEYLAATGGSFSERPFQGLTSQINLYWQDNSTDETGFSVERSTTLGGVYSGITLLPANTTIYSDRGLSAGSTYFYRVSSFKTGATSGFAGPTSAVTYPTIPTAPSNLKFTDRSSNELIFEWDDNSNNESGFAIESSLAGITYNPLAIVGANINTYNADGLSSGTTYFFRVSAFNAGGTSSFAGPTSWTTMRDVPAAPSFTSILAGSSSQIDLNWTNVADENGYDLFRGTTSASLSGITTLGPDVTSFADIGLSAGITYFYRIRGFNESGSGSFSGITSARTIVAPPNTPTFTSILAGSSSQINVNWTNVANETGYNLYRSLNDVSYTGITTLGADVTGFTNSGLSAGTTYFYKIEAFNAGGTSALSGATSTVTVVAPPATPSNFTATTGSTSQINLSWSDVTGENGYGLYSSLNNISYSGLTTLGSNITGYIHLGLCAGTTYWYKLEAFNAGGTSDFAGPTFAVTFTDGGTSLSAPTGFTALSATDSAVTLQWTDTSTNEDGFLIYYRGIT